MQKNFFLILLFNFLWAFPSLVGAQTTAAYDIIFNEIMPDPTPVVAMPNAEFIELYNRSNKILNLNGFKIVNGNAETVLPNFLLKPNKFVVIYTKKAGIDFGKFGADTLQVQKLVALSNPLDSILLVSPTGLVIDVLAYDLNFYQNSKKRDGGWSLERIAPNAPCRSQHWIATNDLRGGTPGAQNSVADMQTDLMPAQLLQIFPKNDRTLTLRFDKSLERIAQPTPPQYISLFEGSPAILTQSVEAIPPFFNVLELKLRANLRRDTLYRFIVQRNLSDCNGIKTAKGDTIFFQLPDSVGKNDVVVNEILFNPEVGGSRFVELFNRSKKAINVANLRIADLSTSDLRPITTDFLLLPNDFVTLTDDPIYVEKRYKTQQLKRKILKNKLPTWSDRFGNAALVTYPSPSRTTIVDSVNYDKNFHNPLLANIEGVSLERIDVNRGSSDAQNWTSAAAATGYATPAQRNSAAIQKKSANDTEKDEFEKQFWFQSNTFSPDDDGFEDVLLLHYQLLKSGWSATIKVFDASGIFLKTLTENEILATQGTLKWEGNLDDGASGSRARVGACLLRIELRHADGSSRSITKVFYVVTKL